MFQLSTQDIHLAAQAGSKNEAITQVAAALTQEPPRDKLAQSARKVPSVAYTTPDMYINQCARPHRGKPATISMQGKVNLLKQVRIFARKFCPLHPSRLPSGKPWWIEDSGTTRAWIILGTPVCFLKRHRSTTTTFQQEVI